MSTLYVAALCGFALVMLMLLVDTVVSLPRVLEWDPMHPTLKPIGSTDGQAAGLPLAGFDPRASSALEPHDRLHEPERDHAQAEAAEAAA